MLLDSNPKEKLSDLFLRVDKIKEIEESIENNRCLIIVSGIRRIGKTSLIKTILNEKIDYKIFIDARKAAVSNMNQVEVLRTFESQIQTFIKTNQGKLKQFLDALEHIKGFNAGPVGFSFDFSNPNSISLPSLFDELDKWAKNEDTKIVIGVDEAQEFIKSKEYDVQALLAYLYDNCTNIVLLITGSEIGLLYEFLELDNPEGFSFARSYKKVKLLPLNKFQSEDFLKQGLKEKGVPLDENALDVVSYASAQLGGVIGWLIIFANLCTDHKKIDRKFVIETQKIGSALTRLEFEKFLKTKSEPDAEKYLEFMRHVANPSTTKKMDFESNPTMKSVINDLHKEHYLEQTFGDRWHITDPVLDFSFREIP